MTAAPRLRIACDHADIDVDKLLADDRLAAAMTAPLVPGTTGDDLHLWVIKLYRHIYRNAATVHGACALLHRHPLTPAKAITDGLVCMSASRLWDFSKADEKLTDIGNARRLAILSGTDIAHDPVSGWRIWTGDSWRGDPDGTVLQRWAKGVHKLVDAEADRLYKRARVAADQEGTEAEAEAARLDKQAGQTKAWALKSQSARALSDMTKLLKDEPGVLTRTEDWNAQHPLIGCPGVTVELTPNGHVLRPPRRADRLTMVTKGRPGTGQATPRWTSSYERAQPDPEVRAYIDRLIGYSLVHGNPERMFVINVGDTSTGKTTFQEVLRHVLGEYAGAFNLSLFRGKLDEGPRQDLVIAMNQRVIFAEEANARWQLHADEVTRLTGNSTILARDLYARKNAAIEQTPAFMPMLGCNHPPIIIDANPATWRRLIAVPWDVEVSKAEEDSNYRAKICTQEADGVLDYLLHCYDQYCAFGIKDPPLAVIRATMKLRDELTVRDKWKASETEAEAVRWEATDDMWVAYRKWCSEGGFSDADRGNKDEFSKWLSGHKELRPKTQMKTFWRIDKETGDNVPYEKRARGWLGIHVRTEEEDEPLESDQQHETADPGTTG